MDNYLLPTDDSFIEEIAKAIAKNRLLNDAGVIVDKILGVETKIDMTDALDSVFEPIFNNLWTGTNPNDEMQRKMYREDARVAIATINLKLLTMTQ